MTIKVQSAARYVIAMALWSLILFQAVNTIVPVDAQPQKSFVVEGKHVRFFLQEQTSNFVPTTSINSKWLNIDVKMDGRLTKGEWTDAQELKILDSLDPKLGGLKGTVHIKNNKESLFIAIDVKDDKTSDSKGDWIEVSFVNYGPLKQNFTSVNYYVEAIQNSALVKYSVIKDGKNKVTSDLIRNPDRFRAGSASFDNNRMYEVKVSLTDPNLKIDRNRILHMKLSINDGSSGKKCQYCAWEIGLASSKNKLGSAMNFKQMVAKRVVPVLDSAYENFLVVTKSAPYNGAVIDIKLSADPKATRFGNPIIIDASKFLPYLASNSLPDTYLYPILHQLAHDFIPSKSPLAFEKPVASAFADLMTYEFFKQMKIPYSDAYGLTILKKYGKDKSPFAKLNWSEEHRTKDAYPTDALMYGIFKQILAKYGWELFRETAATELNPLPSDTETKIGLLLNVLSKSAKKDLTQEFKNKWNFRIIASNRLFDFDFEKIDNIKIVQGGSISKQINISLKKWVTHPVSLSLNGLPRGAKVNFDPAKGNPPFQTKLNLTTSPDIKAGSYSLAIVGIGAGKNHTMSFKLDVVPVTDLIKIELKPDKFVSEVNGKFKFSTSIKSNHTSNTNNKLGLFIDNKLVSSEDFILDKTSKSLNFMWNSRGIDTKVLHAAQVKIMSGDKVLRESNKIKFGVFEPEIKGVSHSKNFVIKEPTAKDPDTNNNYPVAHLGSIKVLLKAKGNYDLMLIAPDGEAIIGKGGLVHSSDKIKTLLDLKNSKIKIMYTGSKASRELLIVEPVQEDSPLLPGIWKIVIVENEKGSFRLAYELAYVPSPELSKGFKN